jgi:hypothetical protein
VGRYNQVMDATAKRPGSVALLVGLVVLAATCITVFWLVCERDYIVELDQAQVQRALDSGFPVEKTYLGIVTVEVIDPLVTLQEHSDRIQLSVSTDVGIQGITRRLHGRAELSGRIRYDAARGAFFAEDPRVEGLIIEGLPDQYADKTRGAVAWLVKGVLERRPVYTLRPAHFRQSVAKLLLKDAHVKQGKLRLVLSLGN